jgi:hypothetical protein
MLANVLKDYTKFTFSPDPTPEPWSYKI